MASHLVVKLGEETSWLLLKSPGIELMSVESYLGDGLNGKTLIHDTGKRHCTGLLIHIMLLNEYLIVQHDSVPVALDATL